MDKESTNLPLYKDIKNRAEKLPIELRAKYEAQEQRCCDVVECLKLVVALKLWFDRGYREIEFEAPLSFSTKKFSINILARRAGKVVGVVCMPRMQLVYLRRHIKRLHHCLPQDSYLILVFPSTVSKGVSRTTSLVDEVWITDETNSKVASMMFVTSFHKG